MAGILNEAADVRNTRAEPTSARNFRRMWHAAKHEALHQSRDHRNLPAVAEGTETPERWSSAASMLSNCRLGDKTNSYLSVRAVRALESPLLRRRLKSPKINRGDLHPLASQVQQPSGISIASGRNLSVLAELSGADSLNA